MGFGGVLNRHYPLQYAGRDPALAPAKTPIVVLVPGVVSPVPNDTSACTDAYKFTSVGVWLLFCYCSYFMCVAVTFGQYN